MAYTEYNEVRELARTETGMQPPKEITEMTTTTFTAAELEADRKSVYNAGNIALVALARKYGATSKRMRFMESEPERVSNYANEGFAICPSKSDRAELERNTYRAIKALQA